MPPAISAGARHLGKIGDGRDIPTRLQRIDIIADVIAGGDSIRKNFAAFKENGRGVFIFLRDGTAGVGACAY